MTILANLNPTQQAELTAAVTAAGGDGVARGAVQTLTQELTVTAPTFSASPDGSPTDGPLVAGSMTNTGENGLVLDTSYAKAVILSISTTGSGFTAVIEGLDTSGSWGGVSYTRLTNLTNGIGSVSQTGTYVANIYGITALRVRLATAISPATLISCTGRTLSEYLPPLVVGQRVQNAALTATTALSAPVQVTSSATYLQGFSVSNTTAADRFLHIATGGTYSNANRLGGPYRIKAGSDRDVAFAGLGSAAVAGLSYQVTTDAAGSAFAVAGDVVGSIRHGN